MSKAKDEHYEYKDTTMPMRDEICTNYVKELEQGNKDAWWRGFIIAFIITTIIWCVLIIIYRGNL